MPRGGSRPGSGRRAGVKNMRTQLIAARAAAEGITPLEVMLQVMRQAWEGQDHAAALQAAERAAPYVHPRLAAVDANINGEVGLTVEIVRFGEGSAPE